MSEQQQQQQSQQPPLPCATGCGFYGRPETQNMCSKCYRDYNQQPEVGGGHSSGSTSGATVSAAGVTEPTTASKETGCSGSEICQSAMTKAPVEAVTDTLSLGPQSGAALEKEVRAEEPNSEANERSLKKEQKDHGHCFQCNRRVGLLGFKCRCGYTFCSVHRYAEQHNCDYDYRARAREQLANANPVVAASKLEKI